MKLEIRLQCTDQLTAFCLSLIATIVNIHTASAQSDSSASRSAQKSEVIDEIRFDGVNKITEPSAAKRSESFSPQSCGNSWAGSTHGAQTIRRVPIVKTAKGAVFVGRPEADSSLNFLPGQHYPTQPAINSRLPVPAARSAANPESSGGTEDGAVGGIPGPESPEGQAVTAEADSAASVRCSGFSDNSCRNTPGFGAFRPGFSGEGAQQSPGIGNLDLGNLMQQLGGGKPDEGGFNPQSLIKNLQQVQQYGAALSGSDDGASVPDPDTFGSQ